MNVAKKYIILILTLLPFLGYSQQTFYQDVCNCGVTGSGYSTGQGSGSGNFDVYIEPGSTIRKAYILSYRIGYPPPATFVLNGNPHSFDTTNYFSEFNHASPWASPIRVYYKDVTQNINPNIFNYSITIPIQSGLPINWGYCTLYLYIVYENPILAKSACSIIINNQKLIGDEFYTVSNINPIDVNSSVGFAVYTDRIGPSFAYNQNSSVSINTIFIGKLSSSDSNSANFNSAGVKGSFYYQNNTLLGLQDDTPNNLVDGADGLADISSYLTNNTTSFNFRITDTLYPNLSPESVNMKIAFFLTYTTPCDTFSTTATALQDTICLGDSVQLNATGGSQYSWFGAFGGLNDTSIANPMASPPQNTTYIVTIKNDSGCVKTEHVKIWVTQPIDSITTTPTVCGNATGSITVHYNTNANYNFTLYDNNFNLLSSNSSGTFNQLVEGVYIVESTLNNCSFYDTVAVGYTNNVQAAFIRNPTQGKAPLTVTLTNISNNANQFIWLLPNDTFYSQHLTYTFINGGSYPVCLVAYNNQPHCADTTCFTFVVEGNIGLIIPNVFTPNNDGHNDVFSVQIIDAELISTIEVIIYNRWGEKMYEYINNETTPELLLWDGVASSGNKASEGTYFYIVSYKTKTGETVTEKGIVSLLR